jgi:hypothetical protein
MTNFTYQEKLCDEWAKIKNLSCKPENLVLIEKLKVEPGHEFFLEACQICGQVYQKKVFSYGKGQKSSFFYKIPGNRVDQCHCIGFLVEKEIIKEEKNCEGNEMYFSWQKETKMQCQKCGKFYKETIVQSNYDGVYFQKYSKD